MARVDPPRRPPIKVDGRYPRSHRSSQRNRWGIYVLWGIGLVGLLTGVVVSAVPWEFKVATNRSPIVIPVETAAPASPPSAPAPSTPTPIAPTPIPVTPLVPLPAVTPVPPPIPKSLPEPAKPTRPKLKAEQPVDLDRVMTLMRNKEAANRPTPPPIEPPPPIERPIPIVNELVAARDMLISGNPWEARDLLIRLQTRVVFRPVSPNTPIRDDVNPVAGRLGAAIKAIEMGNPQYAIQTINGLLTTGLD